MATKKLMWEAADGQMFDSRRLARDHEATQCPDGDSAARNKITVKRQDVWCYLSPSQRVVLNVLLDPKLQNVHGAVAKNVVADELADSVDVAWSKRTGQVLTYARTSTGPVLMSLANHNPPLAENVRWGYWKATI